MIQLVKKFIPHSVKNKVPKYYDLKKKLYSKIRFIRNSHKFFQDTKEHPI
jgi:hypothetical protein